MGKAGRDGIAAGKACPIVTRLRHGRFDVLAFLHPAAGRQFVKGTIESGESPRAAAERELREESGLVVPAPPRSVGVHPIGADRQPWHFFRCDSSGLPDGWRHRAEDDFGHVFTFFWHPLDDPLDESWHGVFHEAFDFFAPRIAAGQPRPPFLRPRRAICCRRSDRQKVKP